MDLAQTPTPLNQMVSAQMRRMPRRDTAPELALRRRLHAEGFRFRLHAAGLPGRPDIVFTRARVAVFVDGCFWHQCPDHGAIPRNNGAWWERKLTANTERDRAKDRLLTELGWLPVHVWEHEDAGDAATSIAEIIRARLSWRLHDT